MTTGTCPCPPGAHDNGTPGGFYVTVKDGKRTGWLAGPYPTHGQALADVADVKQVAERANSRAVFYAFGTSRIVDGNRPGLLNERLAAWRAERDHEIRCHPTPEAAAYLDRIRNMAKRDYGWAVWESLCLGEPVPDRPAGLSVMAAQAVQMRLAPLAAAKRSTAPCMVCSNGGQHINHGPLGHVYSPPQPTTF